MIGHRLRWVSAKRRGEAFWKLGCSSCRYVGGVCSDAVCVFRVLVQGYAVSKSMEAHGLAQGGADIARVSQATFTPSLHLSEVVLGALIFLQQRPFARREYAILALELGIVVELVLDFRQLDMLALCVVWLLHQPFGALAFNQHVCTLLSLRVLDHWSSIIWNWRDAATTQAAAN